MKRFHPVYPLLVLTGLVAGCTLDLGQNVPAPAPSPTVARPVGPGRPCPTLPVSCFVQCPSCKQLSTVDLRGLTAGTGSTGAIGALIGAKISE